MWHKENKTQITPTTRDNLGLIKNKSRVFKKPGLVTGELKPFGQFRLVNAEKVKISRLEMSCLMALRTSRNALT